MNAPAAFTVFSPLPPASRSGIAAYTAELLPALARHMGGPAAVVVARDADAAMAAAALPGHAATVLSERAYRGRPALHALPTLLMLGNSLDHAHVYRAAMRRPGGVVALHDPVLHHLVEALTLGRGSPHAYESVLAYNHGPAGRRLARLRRLGLFSPTQRFLMPLHRQVLDLAAGTIVHSRFAAGRLQGPAGLPVRVVPHHLSPRAAAFDAVTRAAARARLGLPREAPVLLALGHATPAKQLDQVLEALALLRRGGEAPLLVIGGAVDEAMALAPRIAALGLEGQVRLTGWLEEEAFFLHLRAADLLLALRFPAAGESSGTLARALGMGTPVLAQDFGPSAEIPDGCLAKLPYGPDPAPALAARLASLLAEPTALAAMGEAGQRWMQANCSVETSAAAYAEALRSWPRR